MVAHHRVWRTLTLGLLCFWQEGFVGVDVSLQEKHAVANSTKRVFTPLMFFVPPCQLCSLR